MEQILQYPLLLFYLIIKNIKVQFNFHLKFTFTKNLIIQSRI